MMKSKIVGVLVAVLMISSVFAGSAAAVSDFSNVEPTSDDFFTESSLEQSYTKGGFEYRHIATSGGGETTLEITDESTSSIVSSTTPFNNVDNVEGLDVYESSDGYTYVTVAAADSNVIRVHTSKVDSSGNIVESKNGYVSADGYITTGFVETADKSNIIISAEDDYGGEVHVFDYTASTSELTHKSDETGLGIISGIGYNEDTGEAYAVEQSGNLNIYSDLSDLYNSKTTKSFAISDVRGAVYDGDGNFIYSSSDTTLRLSSIDNLGTVKDTYSVSYDYSKLHITDDKNTLTAIESDNEHSYKLRKVVSSLDTSISGNSNSYSSVGSNSFQVNSTATFDDSSTQDVTSDVTYTYDSNIVNRVSGTNEFYGVNSGTTDITASYTDSSGNTVTDSVTVTIQDPAEITNLEIQFQDGNTVYDEGESEQLTIIANYEDGSTTDVTSNSDTTYLTDNSTILSVDSSGLTSANYWGETSISVQHYDSWYDKTYLASSGITVLGDAENIDFKIEESEVIRDENASLSAKLNYEDGRTDNITVNTSNIASSDPANTTYDNVNKTAAFSTSNKTYTLTYTYTTDIEGVTTDLTDSDSVEVIPARDFEDFSNLPVWSQAFVIVSNWSAWAMFASIIMGAYVGVKVDVLAGTGVTTAMLILSWLGGFIAIYVPVSMTLFSLFLFVATSRNN